MICESVVTASNVWDCGFAQFPGTIYILLTVIIKAASNKVMYAPTISYLLTTQLRKGKTSFFMCLEFLNYGMLRKEVTTYRACFPKSFKLCLIARAAETFDTVSIFMKKIA